MQKDRLALLFAIAMTVSSSTIAIENSTVPTISQANEVRENIKIVTREEIISSLPTTQLENALEEVRLEKERVEREEQERLEEQRRLEELEILRLEQERIAEEQRKNLHYNPNNLLEPSHITNEQAYEILEGSALQSLFRAYVYAEESYGVNAIFLMALTSEESAHGRSNLAISNNNLSGIKSRDGGWAYFSDWQESLEFTVNMIKNEYLGEDGLFFNGYSIWNVNTKYCEGYKWSDNINQIAYGFINNIKNR